MITKHTIIYFSARGIDLDMRSLSFILLLDELQYSSELKVFGMFPVFFLEIKSNFPIIFVHLIKSCILFKQECKE